MTHPFSKPFPTSASSHTHTILSGTFQQLLRWSFLFSELRPLLTVGARVGDEGI